MKTRLTILHFNALEWFPPVMNFIDFVGSRADVDLSVISNKNFSSGLKRFEPVSKNSKVVRTGSIRLSKTRFKRINYFLFYVLAFIDILFRRPQAILYYETISALPALIYKKYFNPKVRLLAHYHEYATPKEYSTGMKLTAWQHRIEKSMYKDFYSISQTNEIRLEKFVVDNDLTHLEKTRFRAVPNYPPASWKRYQKPLAKQSGKLIKLVYAGALGYDNMYIKEVIEWVASEPNLSLDIFCYNMDKKAREYLDSISCKNIRLLGGCDYIELPKKLVDYDAGLVFYKPFSENTVHAVSNKVFEYAACGLDVIFSEDMTYTKSLSTKGTYPIIVEANFNRLSEFDIHRTLDKTGLVYKPSEFFCEEVYGNLVDSICS